MKYPSSALTVAIAEMLDQIKFHRTCLSCEHFKEQDELCLLAHVRPPARVLVEGCVAYEEKPPF